MFLRSVFSIFVIIMTTVLIDEDCREGKAFVALLKQMNFARVLGDDKEQAWWYQISEQERLRIEQGLADVKSGKTVSHEEMRKRYEQWL